jgi:hypothetical protein
LGARGAWTNVADLDPLMTVGTGSEVLEAGCWDVAASRTVLPDWTPSVRFSCRGRLFAESAVRALVCMNQSKAPARKQTKAPTSKSELTTVADLTRVFGCFIPSTPILEVRSADYIIMRFRHRPAEWVFPLDSQAGKPNLREDGLETVSRPGARASCPQRLAGGMPALPIWKPL